MKKALCPYVCIVCLFIISACGTHIGEKKEPDVVYIPTPHKMVKEMLKLADVKGNDVVYDLGSGDGRMVIAAARDFKARGVGIEIDENLLKASRESAKEAGVAEKTSFRAQDMFTTDIREATVVTVFLLPGLNTMLRPKFYKELQPGTRIVSHMWDMGDWKPDMTLTAYGSTAYFWFIPADVEGDWNISVFYEKGTLQYTATINQKYQKLNGKIHDKKLSFREMTLYGKEINLFIEADSLGNGSLIGLEGTVQGETMEGTALVTINALTTKCPWKGVRIKK